MDTALFMPLITESAQSKSCAFQALTYAKNDDESGYHEHLKNAQQHLINAHKNQTDILSLNARETATEVDVYLVHAMDHVSNAQMIYDLIQELADIHLKK
ncbi:PTS lactose/cellobiose transporter subunit IIA [Salibacterium halotolerans]|nr:PTS lactose/cellobiose transporter subunit IIA [Salibacterium halotolerans]